MIEICVYCLKSKQHYYTIILFYINIDHVYSLRVQKKYIKNIKAENFIAEFDDALNKQLTEVLRILNHEYADMH